MHGGKGSHHLIEFLLHLSRQISNEYGKHLHVNLNVIYTCRVLHNYVRITKVSIPVYISVASNARSTCERRKVRIQCYETAALCSRPSPSQNHRTNRPIRRKIDPEHIVSQSKLLSI